MPPLGIPRANASCREKSAVAIQGDVRLQNVLGKRTRFCQTKRNKSSGKKGNCQVLSPADVRKPQRKWLSFTYGALFLSHSEESGRWQLLSLRGLQRTRHVGPAPQRFLSPSSHSYRRMERGHTGDVGGQTVPFMAFLEKSAFSSYAHSLGRPLFMWVRIRTGLTEKALSLKLPAT